MTTAVQTLGRQRWSTDRIIAEIHYRCRHGRAVNAQVVQRDDSRLFSAGRRHFGSWNNALRAAGIEVPSRQEKQRLPRGHWTRTRVVAGIKQRHQAGDALYAHALHQQHNQLIAAATYHFGSWAEALRAAGLDPEAIRVTKRRSAGTIIEEICGMAELGADLSDAAVRRRNRALHGAAERYFGSWRTAVAFALETARRATMDEVAQTVTEATR